MDIQSTIIGVVIIIACFTPIIIMTIRRKQREKLRLQAIKEVAKESSSTIEEFECDGDFALGFDKTNNKVFFLKVGEESDIQQVDLSEIKNVYVDKKARIAGAEGESVSVIGTVDLCFSPQNKAQSTIKFSLFTDTHNAQLGDELQFGERWANKLNESMKGRK